MPSGDGQNGHGHENETDRRTSRRTLLRTVGGAAAVGLVGVAGVTSTASAEALPSQSPTGNACTSNWIKFDGSNPALPLFWMDQKVAYWVYSFEISKESGIGIRFSAEFPESRYMSFTAYSTNDRDISGAIRDEFIDPASGRNPFRQNSRGARRHSDPSAGVPGTGAEGTYSVAAVPHDSDRLSEPNTFALPEPNSSKQGVWIMYRIYLPDEGLDDTGGVGLPHISAFDDETGEPVRCPAPVEPTASTRFGSTGGGGDQTSANPPNVLSQDEKLEFVLVDGDAYFGNDDTNYLATDTNRAYGSLATIRWRAPTHAETYDTQVEDYDGEVRYWSMSVGDAEMTTPNTVADFECELTDGFVHLLCGPEALRPRYEDVDGLTYLSWNGARDPILIYRNQIAEPDFEGRLTKCDELPGEVEDGQLNSTPVVQPTGYGAEQWIGEYAPTGRHYRVDDFDPETFVRGEE